MYLDGRLAAGERHQTDQVLATTIDQGRNGRAPDHVNATADQRRALLAELYDPRRFGHAPAELRLDGVAIRRNHIYGLRGHERAQMTCDNHVSRGFGRCGTQFVPQSNPMFTLACAEGNKSCSS